MYTITCDNVTLHNINLGLMVISAKCSLEVNKTGSLTFFVAPEHPYKTAIKKHKSKITLYQDDEALFYGRVLNTETSIDGLMYVECEGELSYLLDSIQRAKAYQLNSGTNVVKTFLESLITNHNSQVSADKEFVVGTVNVTDSNNYLYKITNYENTFEVITGDLIKTYGGFIQIRHQDDKRYIDYLKEASVVSNQKIEFGKNIIDFTQSISGENIYTALIPLGAKLDDTSNGVVEKRLTIKSIANSTSGTIVKKDDYIYDSTAVAKYGYIFHVERWDDVTLPNNLLNKAKAKLSQNTSETMYLELTAIDLHNLDTSIDKFKIGSKIRCISTPHDIDVELIVKSIDIDIDNPANTSVKLIPTIDTELEEQKSLTDKNDDSKKKVDKIEKTVKEDVPKDSEINKKIDNLKDWTNDTISGNNDTLFYNNDSPIKDWVSNEISDNNDTLFNNDNSTIKKWVRNNFPSSTADLSAYAKIADVNKAFDQLATAIEGV